jgi:hypothetical protein
MGCDIHMALEVKKHINNEEKWVNCDFYSRNHYFGVFEDEKEWQVVDVYYDRNYSLFAMLAGVRDYSPGNNKIDEPRGAPEDCSSETKARIDEWGSDGHSHSYCTLKELQDFSKDNPTTKHSGLITTAASKALDETGETPKSWCQGSNNPDHVWREWESDDETLKPLVEAIECQCDKLYIWTREKPENVRIVFWFDN